MSFGGLNLFDDMKNQKIQYGLIEGRNLSGNNTK